MSREKRNTGIFFKSAATPDERQGAFSIRREVFIKEQRIAEAEEWDGLDDACLHFIAIHQGEVIGTARVRFPSPEYAKIERMAVLLPCRRRGVGAGILRQIEQSLLTRGITRAVLHAQITALPFYLACGYTPEGEHFFEAEIEHVKMVKKLNQL